MPFFNFTTIYPSTVTGLPTFSGNVIPTFPGSLINWDQPWAQWIGLPLYPTYGRYGGEGYPSSGDLSQPGLNQLDEYFRQHDIGYTGADAVGMHQADLALIQQLKDLLAAHTLHPDDFLYAQGALALFQAKAYLYDHSVSALFPNPLEIFKNDPLILDLDGDGIELSSLGSSSIHFDYAGDGFAELTGWVSADDGILAIDDNSNGAIDNGLELFGSSTQDGFAVLEKLDSNGDGKVDGLDNEFEKLLVWRDLNQNGVSDSGELQTLAQTGIASISLGRQNVNGTNNGHDVGYEALFTRANASTGVIQTIYFQTDRQNSVTDNTPTFTPAAGVENLPQLAGSGTIGSIAYKATNDVAFRALWTELSDNASKMMPAELRAAVEAALLEWAGVQNVDPQSRGPYVDARHLAFVEAFFGDTYREIQRGEEVRSYPGSPTEGAIIEASFEEIFHYLQLQFLAQTAGSTILRGNAATDLVGDSPYLFFFLLDLSPPIPGGDSPGTPGNVGAVLEFILRTEQSDYGAATTYLLKALSALDGMIDVAFNGDRQAYATLVNTYTAAITDDTIRSIAAHVVDGTSLFGSLHAEGINGTSGDDVFVGGGGGDLVNGDAGSDIYIYGKNDGDLWVKDSSGSLVDVDRLVLTDLNSTDVTFDRVGDNLLIKVTSTGKTILSESFFSEFATRHYGIDVIRFADGTEWDRAQIKDASIYRGDDYSNAFVDSNLDDVLHGSRGDDYISISQGNDTILYGKGDGYDVVVDNSGASAERDTFVLTDLSSSDVELSRVGDDLILTVKANHEYVQFVGFFQGNWNESGQNIDQIRFADGVVWGRNQIQEKAWYRGDDNGNVIQAKDLDDTIVGGRGDDFLEGWYGSDTYIWQKGDGNDQISDHSTSASDEDTLYLKDVTSDEVSFSYQGSTLLITINSTGETIRASNVLAGAHNLLEDAYVQFSGIDFIKFADGETLNRQQIFAAAGQQYLGLDYTYYSLDSDLGNWSYFYDEFGHSGNIINTIAPGPNHIYLAKEWGSLLDARFFYNLEVVYGHNALYGNDGKDILIGGDGKDVLSGGDADDVLFGDFPDENSTEGDNDVLQGGNGNDALYGGAGTDVLDGGDGNDFMSGGQGKDYLNGSAGDDIYVGGAGDDVLTADPVSTSGNDTYVYSRGDGNDLIQELTYSSTENDTLLLTDIYPSDVELSRSGFDLLIRIKSTGETITVGSHFTNRGFGVDFDVAGQGIETIRFADGTEWHRTIIQREAWTRGTDERDVIFSALNDDGVDDIIDGGRGDDVIYSGNQAKSGSDTFVYAKGDGNDIIREETWNSFSSTENDTLLFVDINEADVVLSRSGSDLVITVKETNESILITSQFSEIENAVGSGLEFIQFANGERWSRQKIQQEAWFRGTDGRDIINTVLDGIVRDDTIEAGKGDDIIYSGNQAKSGSDTFVYAKGDGNDVIDEQTWNSFSQTEVDTLRLKDINASDVLLSRNGSDLRITVIETTEVITVIGQFEEGVDASGIGLEVIRFANGETWGRETILGAATHLSFLAGTNGDDILAGTSENQNIYGESGNDIIDGLGGSDLLYGGVGNDTLKIHVSAPGDLASIDGGAGIDTVDMTGFGAAVWLDLVTSGAELRTKDQSDLTSGTWRDIAEIAKVENVIGTAFDDQISGDAGNNIMIGAGGADFIDGRSGDDTLLGGEGDDVLVGGMGADRLDGGNGSDALNGGIGNDTLIGGAGDDVLTGGTEGDVFIFGANSGQDVISDFEAGVGEGHDVVRFDRSVFADFSSVLLASSQVGADVLISIGSGNSVTLQNVDKLDLVEENFEFRRLDNEAPTSITLDGGEISENAPAGTVVGTLSAVDAGDGGSHTFSIDGGAADLFEIVGNEIRVKVGALIDFEGAALHTLNIKATDDDGLFVTSLVSIHVTDQTESLAGTSGADVLTGGAGADVMIGGPGNDRLVGGAGSDTYQYSTGDGDDRIIEEAGAVGNDRLVFDAGILPSNIIVGRSSLNTSDIVLRLATGATIVLQEQLSAVAGSGLEEVKFGDNTVWTRSDILSHLDPDLVIGTSQDDSLLGGEGNETFEGGAGNDALRGYGGGDVYRYAQGDGNDTIVEGYEAGVDRLELIGLTSDEVELSRIGIDLFVKIVSSGETIKVQNQFGVPAAGIEEILFSDSTVWDRTVIVNSALTRGTSGDDIIQGTVDDDFLQGGIGDDVLQGGAGSDTIVYALGDGNDVINDGANSSSQIDVLRFTDLDEVDLLFHHDGADLAIEVVGTGEVITVVGQFTSPSEYWGLEEIHFSNNAVWNRDQIFAAAAIRGTNADETLNGTSSADILDGLGGNDRLQGGDGGDTYLYRIGSGNDTIADYDGSSGSDVVKLVGLDSSDVTCSRSSNDLLIRIMATGETLKIEGQFTGTGGVEQIIFGDGVTWNRGQILDAAWYRGTSGNDSISGSASNDTFVAGLGDDSISGNAGSDTYRYASGDGNDYILDGSGSTTDVDTLRLTDLSAGDVTLSRVGRDLLVGVNATGQKITVREHFSDANANYGIEKIEFADGSSWNLPTINSSAWYRGTSGNDSMSGSSWNDTFLGGQGNDSYSGGAGSDIYIYASGDGNDYLNDGSGSTADIDTLRLTDLNVGDVTLSRVGRDLTVGINATGEEITVVDQFYSFSENVGIEKIEFANGSSWNLATINSNAWYRGTSGNDSISGSAWNDTFFAGQGNDSYGGGAGSDTYIYASGNGNDYLSDGSGSTTDVDTLRLTDLNAGDVTLSRVGRDLLVGINATGEKITIVDQFYSLSENVGIEKIEFANGSSWDLATINSNGWYRGTAGNDSISGSAWNDTFLAGQGNDSYGGGAGSDTYIYASGDGNDYLGDGSGSTIDVDTLHLTDLNAGDITLSRVGRDLLVGINATGEKITVGDHFYDVNANYGVEKIEFANGSSWNLATINSNAWYRGTAGNDSISGSAWNDTIYGDAGNDTLSGGDGDDVFVFRPAAGQDTITDFSVGHDLLEFRDGVFADAAAAFAAASASGSNTIVTIDASTQVLLQNVAFANLHVDDFRVV